LGLDAVLSRRGTSGGKKRPHEPNCRYSTSPPPRRILDYRHAQDDAIFTADGGGPMVWMLRYIGSHEQRRTLTSLVHGTMANAYPQALGIATQHQGIALCGDGGMSMLMGDLLTLVQKKIPVKIIVYNNHSLSFVEPSRRSKACLMPTPSCRTLTSALYASKAILSGRMDEVVDLVKSNFTNR
jgi:pyruvate dehydrogenase (quinone)